MAVGQKRGSRPAGAESPAVRSEDGQQGAACVDAVLMRVARGDAEAFAGVYDQVADAVHGLVRRIVGNRSRAEQVTAEAMVEVWRSAPRFSPAEGSGTDWIMAVARRRAVSHAAAAGDGRAAGLRPAGAAGAAAERAAESPLEHRCLASMPGPQRDAVLLACCSYTWRQVADRAGIPVGRLREGLPGAGQPPGIPAGAPRAFPRAAPGLGERGRQMPGKEGRRA
jgi:RNA polymerase sigma-70 factor, ECF subfamily